MWLKANERQKGSLKDSKAKRVSPQDKGNGSTHWLQNMLDPLKKEARLNTAKHVQSWSLQKEARLNKTSKEHEKNSKTPPEMQLPLTMQLSPDVCILKDWNSSQSLHLRYQRQQTLTLRPNTNLSNLSPLLTRHTPRYLPLSRCSPWKYAMKCNACMRNASRYEQEHLQESKTQCKWGYIYKDNACKSS